jgi:hypothetical protein
MKRKLWAYGDSFIAGDQDLKGIDNADPNVIHYNRYNVSFVAHLAKKLDRDPINRAVPGCGNYPQLDLLMLDVKNIHKEDTVIFSFTTLWRDRFMLPIKYNIFDNNSAPAFLDQSLNEDQKNIPIVDFFYINSILKNVELTYGFKIIKFFAFHDSNQDEHSIQFKKFDFERFIGLNQTGNTLLDVLTDNWGNPVPRISDHSKWIPPKEYQKYFTSKAHPSIEGHKKIADWLYKEIVKNHWV